MALGKKPLLDTFMEHMNTAEPPATPEALQRLATGAQVAQLETLDRIAKALEAIVHSGVTTYVGEL